jgi:hypothetical protein
MVVTCSIREGAENKGINGAAHLQISYVFTVLAPDMRFFYLSFSGCWDISNFEFFTIKKL